MQTTKRRSISRTVTACLIGVAVLLAHESHAMFISPSPAPLNRLIANTQRYIAQNPTNPRGHYTLARLHYLAFVRESDLVDVYFYDEEQGLPGVTQFFMDPDMAKPRQETTDQSKAAHLHYEAQRIVLEEAGFESMRAFHSDLEKRYEFVYTNSNRSAIEAEVKKKMEQKSQTRTKLFEKIQQKLAELKQANWTPRPLSEEDLNHHVASALNAFNQTIKLDASHALALHGLASLKEQHLSYLDETKAQSLKEMEPLDISDLLENYYMAHKYAFAQDKKLETKPMRGIGTLVSFEAGNAYLRIYKNMTDRTTFKQKYRASIVRSNIYKIKQLPPSRTITPIIFSMENNASFSDLLSSTKVVQFDLSGYGAGHLWPWIKPSTSILVYDPDGHGRTTSARQMFGNYTFEIPFDNGYQALSILDDDGNRELTGSELSAIAAWNDINSNGVSDPGEVIPVKDLGISGISVDFRTRSDRFLGHQTGLRLEGGSTLPTWDWLVAPAQ